MINQQNKNKDTFLVRLCCYKQKKTGSVGYYFLIKNKRINLK